MNQPSWHVGKVASEGSVNERRCTVEGFKVFQLLV